MSNFSKRKEFAIRATEEAGDILAEQLRRRVPELTRTQSLFITGGVFAVLEDWLSGGHQVLPAKLIDLVEAEIERSIS